MRSDLLIKFEGEMADAHQLPAYEASQSICGLSRALLIAMNYLDEGRVRRREFAPRGFQINIVGQRIGSFETIYEIITDPAVMTIGAGLGVGIAGNFLTDFLRTLFRRCLGQNGEASIERLEAHGELNPGDMSALEDAIEPSMRAAHTVVNRGAGHVVLISGDNNIVKLDRATKAYISQSTLDRMPKTKLFSIAIYNANQRSGRAFDFELGKTIPFEISSEADRRTISIILSSISSYALRRLGDDVKSAIAIKYLSIVSADDKLKKIIVQKARREIREL